MKRYLPLLISLILILSFSLSSCSLGEISRENELKNSLDTTYEELDSTFSGNSGQYSLVSEYLRSWANKNDIKIVKNAEDHMVLSNPAVSGYEDSASTVLQCPVRTGGFNLSMQPLSVALTALLGPEIHGDITLIVTEDDNGEYKGAASVDPAYYDCDHFISLDHDDDIKLYTSGAYEMESRMTLPVRRSRPSYSEAFSITMSISGHHDPFTLEDRYPNPADIIGSLLAAEKSSGYLFDLASFDCRYEKGYIPTSATAVVVIDENNIEKFTKKFNKSYGKVKKKFEKLNDNFVYTMTETSMPKSVLNTKSSDNIISLMYTLNTGVYLQDEESGDVISLSNISSVSTDKRSFSLSAVSRSLDRNVLGDMSAEFNTTSGLCSFRYSDSEPDMTWTSEKDEKLTSFMVESLGSDDAIIPETLETSEACIFTDKKDTGMISYRFNKYHNETALMNLIHFTESLTQ